MGKNTWICFIIFISCLTATLKAQEQDRQLWLIYRFNKDLKKGFNVGAQYQLRLGNNMSSFRASRFYGIVGYRINKYLATQFVYKYATSYRRDEHIFFVSATGRYRWDYFTLSYRMAYQRVHQYFARNYEPGREPQNEWRHRVTLRYEVHRTFDVYTYVEPYILFVNQRTFFDRLRTSVGVDWHFYKYNTLNVFYIFQPEYNRARPQWQHTLGLSFELDLPKKLKKKKKTDKPVDKDREHREF